MNAAFEEVVDCVKDTKMSAEAFFDSQDEMIKTSSRIIRPLGILLTIFGLFMLFMPFIVLLKWIPLVGWLLGGIVAVAAFVFALVVGTVISCLVIAIAWVFYRPLIGVLMLTLAGIGIYFIFFFDAYNENITTEVDVSTGDATSGVAGETAPASVADSSVTTGA